MRKTCPPLLIVILAASVLAQSGRRIIAPPPAPPPPAPPEQTASESAESAGVGPLSARGELTTLPESILSREIRSLDKGSFHLADFEGKVLVVNIWASWCGPCRREVPEYEQVRKKYAWMDVEFIALTVEDPRQDSERVKQFVKDYKFGFRLGWADRETALTLMGGARAIPQTLVIAPDGRIVSHWRGYAPGHSGDRLREAVERALADG